MTKTTMRIRKGTKTFEILVDLDEAIKFRKQGGSINSVIETNAIFYSIKSGEQASSEDLIKAFGVDNFDSVCEMIVKRGDIEMPMDYVKKEQEQRHKQVVDFLSRNAVDQKGNPYTPTRIMKALQEAKINVKNKPIETQIKDIIEQLAPIIPIKLEMKKYRITVPAVYTGKSYGVLSEYKDSEEWLSNGDLEIIVKVPAGLVMDFFEKLNGVTHGSALSEEVK